MSVKDVDRGHTGPNPMQIAERRAAQMDPLHRQKFMTWFERARVATARADDRIELWFSQAWNADDSVMMAGLIEGASSIPHPSRKRLMYR